MLGRLTLGLAVIVAAIGALIDQFNGGRLHPEQWLGAAALVCGVGLLVGVVRGCAWWLVVPALLFAGTGYMAGLMSRLGIEATETFGEPSVYVSESTPGGTQLLRAGYGNPWISVDGTPAEPLTIDARVGIGTLEMSVVDNVAVEIRHQSERGDLVVNGTVVTDGAARLGPAGPPDVIVDARQGIGDVTVSSYNPDARFDEIVADDQPGAVIDDPLVLVHPDVGVLADGWIVLADGEALLAPDNSVAVGDVTSQGPDLAVISTSIGAYVVEGDILHTPDGVVFGLEDLRQQASASFETAPAFGDIVPDVAASTTAIPSEPIVTVAPSRVDTTAPENGPPTTFPPAPLTTVGG